MPNGDAHIVTVDIFCEYVHTVNNLFIRNVHKIALDFYIPLLNINDLK